MKHDAFFGAECSEKIIFDHSESEVSEGEFFPACCGELDDVTSSICGIAVPGN
jgi:hypothetical protein